MQLNVIIGLCQTTKTKKSSRSYVLMKSWEEVVCMIISGTFLQTYNLIRDFLSIHAFKGLVSTIYFHSHLIAKNIKIICFSTRYFVYQISDLMYNNEKDSRYSTTFYLYHIITYFYNKDTFHGKMNLTFASSFISKHNLREINNSKNP